MERDDHYQGNIAQYLLDLNEECATLNFCGGMMFQLVLTNKLKSHLQSIASSSSKQPIIHPQSQSLMARIPNYTKSSNANNISIFHGRELRGIQSANGGMGFVLQLSYADPEGVEVEEQGELSAGKGADVAWSGKAADPQGWSIEEITTYDGWRSDQFRKWRTADTYQSEGFTTFITDFNNAPKGYGLNHRFYLHFDKQNRMWLCAEDGCEGTPVEYGGNLMDKIGGMFGFGK